MSGGAAGEVLAYSTDGSSWGTFLGVFMFQILGDTTQNTYTVTYDGNGNTGGSVPVDSTAYHTGDTVTVSGNTGSLVKTGSSFTGWNTAANGSGTSYSGGQTFAMESGNVTLYAQWTAGATPSRMTATAAQAAACP